MSRKKRSNQFQAMRRTLSIETLEGRCMLSCSAPNADFNSSGTVDAADLGVWQSGYGSGTAQNQGDSDGDSDVDGADLLAWQRTFGQSPPPTECIDISIDGLSETVEENPGAIVWRNSDFSKLSLDATQPEAGEPLYVPDYSAPSGVYDPNNANDFTTATVEIDPGMIGQYNVRFTFDNLQIELWTTSTWAGLDAQGGGLSKIQSGFNLVPNSNMISFQIEGLENSAAFATDFIQVEAIPNGGGATLEDQGFYTVVETGIGVDGNRDTEIDFESNYDRQLLFWLNNDQEGLDEVDTMVESEQPNIATPDNTDNVIGQRRDLEDLAPLRIQVEPLLVANTFNTALGGSAAPGQLKATYRMLLENSAGASLRLFPSFNTQSNVIRHVSDETTASVQASSAFLRTEVAPSFSDQMQLGAILSGENGYLFEAIGAAYGTTFTSTPTLVFETTIEYADGSTTKKRQEVNLDLRDIKQFYTRWDINYGVNGGASGTDLRTDLSFKDYPTPTTATQVSQIKNKPFLSGEDTTVLVHGWNTPDTIGEDWKAATAETMYKRLYWQGYRGEFVAFNWPTYEATGSPLNETYNPSEFQAYRSANALKEILAEYRGTSPNLQPVQLLAHSMGNIVAGEALRLWTFELPFNDDPLVTNYVAMQAAVSAGAYGSNGTDSLFPGRPEPDLYRFWSHGQDDGLTNPNLGTSYYFQGAGFASENSINMYNQADFALLGWDGNNILKEAVDEFLDPFEDPYYYWTGWPYGYIWESGPEQNSNVNDDTFGRYNPDETLNATLTLTNAFGRPGVDAYEIMAFFAQSADTALGTKSVNFFDKNIDIQSFGLLGGNDIRANHSYQFNQDAAETWDFYVTLKSEIGFGATYGAIAATLESAVIEDDTSTIRLRGFQPLIQEPKSLRPEMAVRAAMFEWLGQPDRVARLDLLLADNRFGSLGNSDELAFLRPQDGKDEASDQELKDTFFDVFEDNIALSHLSWNFGESRLPS